MAKRLRFPRGQFYAPKMALHILIFGRILRNTHFTQTESLTSAEISTLRYLNVGNKCKVNASVAYQLESRCHLSQNRSVSYSPRSANETGTQLTWRRDFVSRAQLHAPIAPRQRGGTRVQLTWFRLLRSQLHAPRVTLCVLVFETLCVRNFARQK